MIVIFIVPELTLEHLAHACLHVYVQVWAQPIATLSGVYRSILTRSKKRDKKLQITNSRYWGVEEGDYYFNRCDHDHALVQGSHNRFSVVTLYIFYILQL